MCYHPKPLPYVQEQKSSKMDYAIYVQINKKIKILMKSDCITHLSIVYTLRQDETNILYKLHF